MTEPHDSAPPRSHVARRERIRARQSGWSSGDVVRAAALVIAMFVLVRLVWVANPLFLTAFIGILFGLAVSSGVDRLARLGVRRGVGAALIGVAFFTLLVSFGAWLAPTIHAQGLELRRRLPDAIDRFDDWVNARREGFVGLVFSGFMPSPATRSPARSSRPARRAPNRACQRSRPPRRRHPTRSPSRPHCATDLAPSSPD